MRTILLRALAIFSALFSPLSAVNQCYDRLENSEFFAGYLHGKLEERYPEVPLQLAVEDEKVIVFEHPNDEEVCNDIFHYLNMQPEVTCVKFDKDYVLSDVKTKMQAEEKCGGCWFPELTKFFPTLLADPRIIGYSAGYRTCDRVFHTPVIPISMGDRFSIYSYRMDHGLLHLSMEAAVWAVFEAKTKSLALLNADYFVSIPLAYFYKKVSAQLRIYHESSHLGDEYLLEKKHAVRRVNPSMEVLDLFGAYQLNPCLLIYSGTGYVLRSDHSYKVKPWSFEYGLNYEMRCLAVHVSNLEATPYFGAHLRNLQNNHWNTDTTLALGYQADKSYGHKMRLYLEAHDGFSLDGQFSRKKNRYLAIKLLYGY
jgi:hypothetical protein